jgi:RNA polymerase sigma-70 factor (ECF subfamily)
MDREALVELFDRYSSALYNYALRLTNDPLKADHIVGEVFAKLLEEASTGRGPQKNLRSYLYERTYHLALDRTRYSRREDQIEVADFLRKESTLTQFSMEDQRLFDKVVLAFKSTLTDDQRHVIILRFLEGFTLKDVAEISGKEVNTVKGILRQIQETLRSHPELQAETLAAQWRLPGDSTVDAPPPKGKKKKKGKGK